MSSPLKFTLSNGLKVIFQQNKSAKVAALQVWINIGSRDELRGHQAKFQDEGGLAHIQEHMLFQGSKSFPNQGEIASIVEGCGGDFNAWTNFDETVYHITMPSKHAQTGIKILASMVSEATIESDRLKKELEVIMEEFRRCNDDPHTVLQEELFKVAYQKHPYHHPIIGYEKTIRAIDRQTVQHFFDKYYAPANMTVVIVGDLSENEIKKWVKSEFGKIKNKKNPKNLIPAEPKQRQEQVLILRKNFEGTYLSIAHHISKLADKDTPAVDVLYSILGNGIDSRLNKNLFEKLKLVYSIYADVFTPKDPGLGFIDVELKPENIKPALTEIFKEIFKLHRELVSEEELQKTKLQLQSQFIYNQETFQGIARNLGHFELNGGGHEQIASYLTTLKNVNAKNVQAVAKKFLTPANTTIGLLLPQKENYQISQPAILKILKENYQNFDKVQQKTASTKSLIINHIHKITLKNGLRLILKKNDSAKAASFRIAILGGLLNETKKNNGITNMIAELLTRGTDANSAEILAKKTESMASIIIGFSNQNCFGLEGKALSENLIETFNLALDMLKNANFSRQEIEKIKPNLIDEIKRELDNPIRKVFNLFQKTLYGNHPYSLNQLGSIKNIQKFSQSIIKQQYLKLLDPKNIVISVVGDINIEKISKYLSENLENLKIAKPNHVQKFKINFSKNPKTVFVATEKNQSNILLGFPALEIGHPQVYSLEILKKVLAGMGGRLFINLRDKQSLAYSITALSVAGYQYPGYFVAYIGCAPEKQEHSIQELKRELKEIQTNLITDKELIDAKNFLIGEYDVRLQSNISQVIKLCSDELYGLGFSYDFDFAKKISHVTKNDVLKIAKDIINLDKVTIAIVGPKKTS
ncbi:MAG: peptidase, m16 (pitrilysin) family, zinc protease [Candidatus Peregrinibacteria bacterium GW2011_GWF2_33_10]|nr:MAG: peptidase, m16 (pitrilysin) family, zinc protease [Candidatus Peregrinibacteria bacterium GW2011_GWF2_33_10]OGJ44787.1 MAG: hypothetical protein A2263_06130 [Candidatus Peregrinibacteria bacterium RIFOXYA2_FULL_33_21]OGJ46549.1 MAG: hypothetical protein A2272_01520 [Candidatus Peregrinibacteria bacterium RIFOXYA12_FULL_33_12]OGJ50473.1 MAG: hypothetical protein A2307_02755 [Candidatus Peregrinibacteria bacterium RIFOXYB2_FULL_33_20]